MSFRLSEQPLGLLHSLSYLCALTWALDCGLRNFPLINSSANGSAFALGYTGWLLLSYLASAVKIALELSYREEV